MKNAVFLLINSYIPNTATANRILAYLRSLDKMKIPVKVVFFLPDDQKSRINETYEYVSVEYYWNRFYINNRVFKYFSYYLYTLLLKNRLTDGDKVYIYADDYLLKKVLEVKGVKVFFEKTENPEASLPKNRLYHPTVQSHLELCRHVDALFVISKPLKDYYASKGIDESRIHIINIIVDAERFSSVIKTEKAEKYVAYCGTADNNKDGVDILIKAFAKVLKVHPEVKLYVIGKTPSKNEAFENHRLVESLGIEEKVVMTGVVPAEKMPSLLKNATILALARPKNKQADYGFPTKLGEYLLTANPIVVTSVGDIPRFLHDGENAYMSSPGDVNSFAEKLLYALDHPEESRMIGTRGRDTALMSFDSYKETKKLIDIINQ